MRVSNVSRGRQVHAAQGDNRNRRADVDGNGAIDAVDIQKVVLYILNAT